MQQIQQWRVRWFGVQNTRELQKKCIRNFSASLPTVVLEHLGLVAFALVFLIYFWLFLVFLRKINRSTPTIAKEWQNFLSI